MFEEHEHMWMCDSQETIFVLNTKIEHAAYM